MIIEVTSEQAEFRDAVRAWVQKVVVPRVSEVDFDQPLTRQTWEPLRDSLRGYGIIDEMPRTEAGRPDWVAFGILLEEVARVEPALGFFLSESIGTAEMYRMLMTEDQQERFAHLLTGHASLAGAFTEPEAGSNSAAVRTTATRTDDGDWLINGTKIWISGANIADAIMVSCRTVDPRSGEQGAGLFLVEAGPGILATPIPVLGLRAHPTCEVVFTDVPAEARSDLSGPKTFATVNRTLATARCMMAVMSVGIAQGALDLALSYAGQRVQFGRPIASFQLVQQMLAEMATEVMLGRLLAFRALNVLNAGGSRAALETSMAKGWCTEMCGRVASTGVQVHGAMGLSTENRPEKYFRDARMMSIPDGTTQIQNLIIGRELTGVNAIVPAAS